MHQQQQFGMRENPASDRQHGSRTAAPSLSDERPVNEKNVAGASPMPGPDHLSMVAQDARHAASPRAATGGENLSTPMDSTVASSRPLPSAMIQRDFEPLIGSYEAARLLGKINVKTLQRYARHRNIPGYQIGGHWYFRASELDSWLRSRLNSSCHPCRLQEESDGT